MLSMPSAKRRRRELSGSAPTDAIPWAPAETGDDGSQLASQSSTPLHVREVLQANPLFSDLESVQLQQLIAVLLVVECKAGQTVIQEGDYGHNLYIVESGEYGVPNTVRSKEPRRMYTQGESFGEVALVHNVPRTATITCVKEGTLWALDRESFQKIILSTKRNFFDTRLQMVKMCKVFASLTDKQMSLIASELQEVAVEEGVRIVAEGDLADSLYLIKEGSVSVRRRPNHHSEPNASIGAKPAVFVRVSSSGAGSSSSGGGPSSPLPAITTGNHDLEEEELRVLRAGDFFGESSLCADQHRLASVVAKTPVTLLKLTRESFGTLFGYGRTWAHSRGAGAGEGEGEGAAGEPAVVRSSSQVQLEHDLEMLVRRNLMRRLVADLDFLSPLSASEKEMLCEHLYEAPFLAGETIIRQGDPAEQATTFYMVKSGAVRITQSNADGQTVVLKEQRGAGEFFGEMSLLKSEPRHATVTAIVPTVCMCVDATTFNDVLGPMSYFLKRASAERSWDIDAAQRAAIRLDDLRVHLTLGVGAFGRVKLVTHEPGGKRDEAAPAYALKCISKGQVRKLQQVEHVLNEKNILAMCRHPFLPRLVAKFHDATDLYMLLELALGGELFSVLTRHPDGLPTAHARFYAAAVTAALAYLHDLKIVHRDLKPENVLLDGAGHVKLVDFGLAKMVDDVTWTFCGTPDFLAPETILNKGHAEPVDWWGLGVLLYEMLLCTAPFVGDDPMATYRRILACDYRFVRQLEPAAEDLIRKLLVVAPASRLGGSIRGGRDVKAHPFFAPLNFAKLVQREVAAPFVPPITSALDASNFDQSWEDEGGDKPAALNTEYWNQYHDEASDDQIFADF